VLRADRTFIAGAQPSVGSSAEASAEANPETGERLWIIDFKTTEQGSRSAERFEQEELLKYRHQLERYAAVVREFAPEPLPIALGLYYPLLPRLVSWLA
jgi:hypothetical protein